MEDHPSPDTTVEPTAGDPPPAAEECFVVGIGASAGGLESLEQFFRNAPTDKPIAYVVVQHLSPDFESLMDKLLSRETSLTIRNIDDGVVVEPRTVYLLPPNHEVILSAGRLLLAQRSEARLPHFPIDSFFRSLAADAGHRAIAVVMSGAGSDGSRGIREVHEAGGFVVAQSEASAKFDGMPRSACDSGIVDLVAVPAEMPSAIVAYTESPLVTSRRQQSEPGYPVETAGPVSSILSMLRNHYEVDFRYYKTGMIARRIERRVMLSGCDGVNAYVEMLRTDSEELDTLYRDLLIGVTGFFRDREVFERLELDVITPLLTKLHTGGEVRVWVVATATGEEAYSLAILLSDIAAQLGRHERVRIFASDIHGGSLEFASRGVYPPECLAGLTTEQRGRYFEEKPDGFHATPDLRKMVVFVHHNVITNAPFTNLDLISCRNLFIYLTPETQKKVLSLFHFGLKTGGVLCLGSSETPGALAQEFEAIDEQCRIYRKHRDIRLPATARMPFDSVAPTMPMSRSRSGARVEAPGNRELLDAYDRLFEQFIPPGLLLGPENELVHTFGAAGKHLVWPDGRPPKDVLDMLTPALRQIASSVVRRATLELPATGVATVPPDDDPSAPPQQVRVTAVRLKGDKRRTMLTFEPEDSGTKRVEPQEIQPGGVTTEEYEAIERELALTKDQLQSTVEEAQTTNEELQSANEQLTASNEELQSTNEELHSVNEELYTVNAEHQRKIDELVELTDDMDNLLNSTNVHTIFLDRSLSIRRFTPGIGDTFNLIPQDIGRRLDTFTHNIRGENVAARVREVVATRDRFEREVKDQHGGWYLLRILPYTTRGEVDGAVITLVDITSLKKAESKLAELSEIVEHSDDAIFRLDVDGAVRTWNRGAERLFGKSTTVVLGTHVSTLGLRCKDLGVEQMLRVVESGQSLDNVEAKYSRAGDEPTNVSLSMSPIREVSGEVIGASAIARDVTKQKRAEGKVIEALRRRDEFLAMLSHELRNPLAAVLNATDLLGAPEADDSAIDEAKGVIDHNVRHVARILDDLLDVSRITNDKINLHREVVDLCELMIDVVECVQHRIDAKQQELHVEHADRPVFVDGDVGRLQQMQVNLLVNASKYTPAGGRIEFRVELEREEAVVTISDNGDGINADLIESIFEPFVQADQTIDRAQGGMGLGLTLVSKVVEAHDGSVAVKSEGQGLGSEFVVRIPTTDRRPQRRTPTELTRIDGMKMLVVEDNDGVRAMLARTLELKGFTVRSASSGSEGLRLIEEFDPEIAIIDIGLPDLNGYDLAKSVRQMPERKSTLLVALTGYGRSRDRQAAIAAGFDIHLVKPLDPNELLRAVAERFPAAASV